MKYIAACSFGKDSNAQVYVAREHGEPLDELVYSEVMFDKDISGELPEHRDFIYNIAIPKFERMGLKVNILRAEETYIDRFFKMKQKGERAGQIYGFPPVMKCWVNSDIKMKPIKNFWKNQSEPIMQYVGIAIDEEERLDRIIHTENKVSLLQKYHLTEADAYEICKKNGVLSPIYDFSKRDGCWFCQNQSLQQLEQLRKRHPVLWKKLLELQKYSPHPFKIECPMEMLEHRFFWKEQQFNLFDELYEWGILKK